jgi:mannonate dehydratase
MRNSPQIPSLEQTWRWFGPDDPVPLAYIRQAGATGIVTALHHVPNGVVWTVEEIKRRQAEVESAGMRWSVVESLPVHEDIKQAKGRREEYLENYRRSLRNLAGCGIRVICYNFMALTDWTRTNLAMAMPDGSEALRFDAVDAALFDIHLLQRPGAEREYTAEVLSLAATASREMTADQKQALARNILLGLPGTVEDFSIEDFRGRLSEYADIDAERLRLNHAAFLRAVIPVAEECGTVLAIHPDDPPFPIFGLPRIARNEVDLAVIVEAVDSPANGITFCTGSLGANLENDLPRMLRRFGSRVHFLHLRNVEREANGSFYEADHLAGSTDMADVMRVAIEVMRERGTSLPMRPDHGHRMMDDLKKEGFYAGYSAIGRLRGLAELRGLEAGLRFMM